MGKFAGRDEVNVAIQKNIEKLLIKRNVIGAGIGKKHVGGAAYDHEDYVLAVFVTKKVPKEDLFEEDLVPKELSGIKVDVVALGDVQVLRTSKHRPAVGGVSIGHKDITAGTLGSVVLDRETGERLILSNNHVLANSNAGRVGDEIYQPGPHDGGTSKDTIGRLHRFVPIKFQNEFDFSNCPIGDFFERAVNFVSKLFGSKTRIITVVEQDATNLVDAAVALPDNPDDVSFSILGLIPPYGIALCSPGDTLVKSGRTTAVSYGTVQYVDAEVEVGFGDGRSAYFVDQIITTNMAQGGDSGSLVCMEFDGDAYAAGLLFAGSDQATIVNKMDNVVDALGIYISPVG